MEKKAENAAPPPEPIDIDEDGVADDIDQCTDTPGGALVNHLGCWLPESVYFEFDKSEIRPEFYASLVEIADVMHQNPGIALI